MFTGLLNKDLSNQLSKPDTYTAMVNTANNWAKISVSLAESIKNGMQYKLRKELEEEALDYINYAESNNFIIKDSYLESYLYTINNKIYPIKLGDGRPGILNIKVLKSTNSNVFIFSNGIMFITTGLLSTISSEGELIRNNCT